MARHETEFPAPKNLSASCKQVLYFFVADNAFTLSKHTMKPYSSKNLSMQQMFLTIGFRVLVEMLKTLLVSCHQHNAFLGRQIVVMSIWSKQLSAPAFASIIG